MAHFSNGTHHSRINMFAVSTALFVCLIAFFASAVSGVSSGTIKRQKEALEDAVTRDITECYALEGHYPRDVYYMMEHYNLSFNEDRFYVDYRVRGSNVRPEFTVIVKEDEE